MLQVASIQRVGNKFRAQVRRKGHRALCRTFKSEREAIAWGRRTEADLEAGRPVSHGTTVGQAIEAFREIRDRGPRPIAPASNEEYMLRHLADGLGSVPVDSLNPKRLAEWCRLRADDGAGPYTVSMEVGKLATVLKYAAVSLHTVFPDVVGAARPLLEYSGLIGPGKARERRPSKDELEAVLARLEPTMADVVRFAVATAMRRGEICRIKWADVDEERRLVLVRDRKHPKRTIGNHVWVPLIDRTGFDAWKILKRQHKDGEAIFPVTPEYVSDSFADACTAAGVVDLHFHDLRHEATSRLFESGMSIEQVAIVTGHADWRSLKRYANLKPESLTAGTRQGTRQRPDNPRTESRRQRKSAP